jgi:hypothetical protein
MHLLRHTPAPDATLVKSGIRIFILALAFYLVPQFLLMPSIRY